MQDLVIPVRETIISNLRLSGRGCATIDTFSTFSFTKPANAGQKTRFEWLFFNLRRGAGA